MLTPGDGIKRRPPVFIQLGSGRPPPVRLPPSNLILIFIFYNHTGVRKPITS